MAPINLVSGYGKTNSFIKQLPKETEICKRIHDKVDALIYKTKDGKRKPYVCAVCD